MGILLKMTFSVSYSLCDIYNFGMLFDKCSERLTVQYILKMKKASYLLIITVLLLNACTKDNDVNPLQEESFSVNMASLSFVINQADLQLKNAELGPQCKDDLQMDYAVFVIGGVEYSSLIQFIDGAYRTQAIEIATGNHTLESFLVYNYNRSPRNREDDIIIKAAPQMGSDYYDFINNSIEEDFIAETLIESQISIDVLCYDLLFYNEFGFITPDDNGVRIEQQVFSGEICVEDIEAYSGSLYEDQSNGIQYEIPAIFEIHVYKEGITDPLRIYSNENWIGEDQNLYIYWLNDLSEEEVFNFELWVLLPTQSGFDYVLMNTWTLNDNQSANTGSNDIVDFKVGRCLSDDTDYSFDYSTLGTGDVQITLRWADDSDLDLWVTDPSSETISFNNPSSTSGGLLDIDDTDGYGPENIFWPQNEAPIGEYLVQLHHFSGEGPSTYSIDILFFGNTYSFSGIIYENELIDIANLSLAKNNIMTSLVNRQLLDPLPIK